MNMQGVGIDKGIELFLRNRYRFVAVREVAINYPG